MKKICYIVGAGEFSGRNIPLDSAYIIAADAGYKTLKAKKIEPNLIIGDFDSLSNAPEHPNIIKAPTEKNDTDMALAVKHGLKTGLKTFIIDGGIGGRLDHTLANIQLLKKINQNKANGILLGKEINITTITNQTISFAKGTKGTISIFTMGDKARGVTLKGLKYTLNNATLTDIFPIGVSNEFATNPVAITVKTGTLVIAWEHSPTTITFENGEQVKII